MWLRWHTLCETHERTIYRDIDTLNASGIPCAYDKENARLSVSTQLFHAARRVYL